MLINFTTVRSEGGASQLLRPATPNGVSASSTWLTPTATNSVSLGFCDPRSNSAKRTPRTITPAAIRNRLRSVPPTATPSRLPFQEALEARMVLRFSVEPGRQSCSSGQPNYYCSERWRFQPPGPHKPPPLHRQLHEQWSPQPNCPPSHTCRSISKRCAPLFSRM